MECASKSLGWLRLGAYPIMAKVDLHSFYILYIVQDCELSEKLQHRESEKEREWASKRNPRTS